MISASTRIAFALSIFLCACFTTIAIAAPVKSPGSLPLTGDDLLYAEQLLKTKSATEDFAYFIKSLDVFPDHQNPVTVDEIENINIKKLFFITPFFQASKERSVVGMQEFADEAHKIISEIYELVTAFDLELFKIGQLTLEKNHKVAALNKLYNNITHLTDPLALTTSKQLVSDLERELATIEKKLDDLENKADRAIDETSSDLRNQVVNQIEMKLALIGVSPTEDEEEKLKSSSANDLRSGIAHLLARATSHGQFGYRVATFEAGYTEQQKNYIALYRTIRPDVQVNLLSANTVYARATALTAKNARFNDADYFTSEANMVSAPRLFLAVNGGSNGACGSNKTCNVILEFTWLGATMAKTSQTGAITLPIYFEADVSFMQPDFMGSVSCDFSNGFNVSGRADVKDGAIIYDGDVYNQINYASVEEGACDYAIEQGDKNSAAYHTIKYLYDNYMQLKMQRATKSRAEIDEYRAHINRELNFHASGSQNTNFDFWSLTTWITAFGQPWGTIASFVVGGARGFYWHTRVEESSVSESVKFSTTFSETNVQTTERMAFDGFPILCWKKDGSASVLTACPDKKLSTYISQSDTDLGKNQNLCGENGASSWCNEQAEQSMENTAVDDEGVIVDPWA